MSPALLSRKARWKQNLEKLRARELPVEQIGHTIVALGKPFDIDRVKEAKDVVASYLDHDDSWVRHEALWFLVCWGRLCEYEPAVLHALRNDPNPDNRGYAAVCLARLCGEKTKYESLKALRETVENEQEDRLVRLNAYAALLEVTKRGINLPIRDRDLEDIDWKWVRSLAP